MSHDETMCYVAADPTQPGAAWGMCSDDPKDIKYTAKDLATWVKQGATIMRVDVVTASEMLKKWKRPARKAKA